MKAAAILAGLCVVFASPRPLPAAEATKFITSPDLVWTDIKALPPGAQISVIEGPLNEKKPFIFRIKFQPGWKVPAHSHSVLTHVTVISGKFNLGVGNKFDASVTHALAPGSVVIMPPGENHFAWIEEETVIQVHSIGPWDTVWVDPKDDPANKKTN
jgi:quercetin dioxygenase-like cupin family protein